MQGFWEFVGRVLPSWWARAAGWALGAMALYQFLCDQFDFPTLPAAWQLTGAHLPWWGWLLIAQGLFFIALVNYVRSLTTDIPAPAALHADDEPEPYPDVKFEALVEVVVDAMRRQRGVDDIPLADIALEILDKGKLRDMHIWGRSGASALAIVSQYEWESAQIDWSISGIRVPGGMSSYLISDLHFYSEEIDKIWPIDK